MSEEGIVYLDSSAHAVIATPSYSIKDLLNTIEALRAIIDLQDREITDLQEALAQFRAQQDQTKQIQT